MKNKTIIIVSAILIITIAFTSGYFVGDLEPSLTNEEEIELLLYQSIDGILDEQYEGLDREVLIQATVDSILASADSNFVFYEVLDDILGDHYTQPEREEIMLGAIEGLITALDDPHTRYFDFEEAQEYDSNFAESYVGIGVSVRFEDGQIFIEVVKEDGPADQSGLRVGDVITHVDGEMILEDSFYETINKILGDEGTEVIIGVYRPGNEETLYFPITRAVIDNSSVEYEIIEEAGQDIGYIKVTQFGDETSIKFQAAVNNLENQGIDSLVVDLRDNGGGHLVTVFNMLNEFLIDDGNPMFSTEYYRDNTVFTTDYHADNTSRKSYNIVTLINENSASASEVFASAMSEHGGYPVIGVTSYGKGTMQTTADIISTVGDSLHLSIGKWITADGNWVHYDGGTDGVTPDITVEQTEIENAYKVYLVGEDPLEFDTVDSKIANIQVVLNMMGYTVRTDGYFDLDTFQAVEDIQTNNSLTVNGILNQDTLDIINAELQVYLSSNDNDTQLQASVLYLVDNPGDPNE